MTDAPAADQGTSPPEDAEARLVPHWLDNLAALSWRVLVVLAAIVVAAYLAGLIWTVTASILLAIVVAAIFSPLTLRLRSGGRSRTAAAGITWLVAIGTIGGALLILVIAVLPYVVDLINHISEGTAAFQARLEELEAPAFISRMIEDFVEQARASGDDLVSEMVGTLANIGGILVLGTFLLFFFLRDGDKAWAWLFQSLSPEQRDRVTGAGDDALGQVGGYLRGTTVVGLVAAVTNYLFLVVLDVPLPFVLALLTFAAAFIPYFGIWISGITILLVTLGAHDLGVAALMLVLLVTRDLLAHYLLKPRLFTRTVEVHPALVLIVLPAGFQLGGLLGLFAAVPVTALVLATARSAIGVIAPEEAPPLPELVPAWLDRAAQWSWRALVGLALVALLLLILSLIPLVLVPLILALIFTATLAPLVDRLVERGQSRGLASAISVVGSAVIIVGVLALAMVQLVNQVPELGDTTVDGAEEIDEAANGYLGMATDAVDSGVREVVETVTTVGTSLASLATVTVLSVLLTFFFLRDGAGLWRAVMANTRSTAYEELTEAGKRSLDVLGGYMIGTGAISFVGAFSQAVIMWILGLPLVLPVFVLSFFGGFIPYIGSALTTMLAFLIAVAVGDTIDIIIMLIWTVVFNLVQGNIVAPLVYGRTAHIHPAIVLVAIPAASSVAGILGMFIVVPVLGVVAGTWRTVLSVLGGEDKYQARPDAPRGPPDDADEPAGDPVAEPAPGTG